MPNLTLGHPVVKCLRKHTTAFLDCHVMVSNVRQWIKVRYDAHWGHHMMHWECRTSHTDGALYSLGV